VATAGPSRALFSAKRDRQRRASRLLKNSPFGEFSALPATDSRQTAGFTEKREAFFSALLAV
jgi:hypothetical protein